MKTKWLLLTLFGGFMACSLFAEEKAVLLKDDFSSPQNPQRRATRGDWKIGDGVASCTQDDELYKKHKDHGPIIFYGLPHETATISFQIKSEETKNVAFTANSADGHVFRFTLSPVGLNLLAYPPSPDHKPVFLAREKSPTLKPGEWISVTVTFKGDSAKVKLGPDFEKLVQHPSLAKSKSNLSIGFAFGTLSIKDWVVTE